MRLRLGAGYDRTSNSQIREELSWLDAGRLVDGLSLSVGYAVVYKRYRWELELTTTEHSTSIFERKTHEVKVQSLGANIWFRLNISELLEIVGISRDALELSPGVSVGYVRGNVVMQYIENENWIEILSGNGIAYSFGVILAIPMFSDRFWFDIEYRYRSSTIEKTSTKNGGELFFPGDPAFNFTGHLLGIGVGVTLWSSD